MSNTRNRVIYQSEAVYVGPSPASGFHFGTLGTFGGSSNDLHNSNNLVKQLQRVQTANYSFNVERTDVNQFGQLAAIDRIILTNPTVSLDLSYINANLANEKLLGFNVVSGNTDSTVQSIVDFMGGSGDERNYFIRTVSEGSDAVDFASSASGTVNGVIGIGNGRVTSFSTEASVGNFPTTTINIEGYNMKFDKGTSGNFVPAINLVNGNTLSNFYTLPTANQNVGIGLGNAISALRPGDITVSIPSITGADTATMNVQSYTLSLDIGRTPIEKLGNRFAFTRPIDFPLTVTLSVDAQVTDLIAGNFADLLDDDSPTYNPSITIKSPTNDALTMAKYTLKGAKLDSEEFSSDIGSNKTVTLNFSAQVGGPQDSTNGLFMNGQF
jgi:hypothetical protein